MNTPKDDAEILAIQRPHPALWTYYLLRCLVIPPLFPILVLPMYFRYHSMRYKFDEEGISMSWGILFRREIILNYARIQDIHLQSNIIERWLGLARILIQTASGSSSAEMTLEGLKQFEQIRDFLYSRMRGVTTLPRHSHRGPVAHLEPEAVLDAASAAELVGTLREIGTELRALNERLARRGPSGTSEGTTHV